MRPPPSYECLVFKQHPLGRNSQDVARPRARRLDSVPFNAPLSFNASTTLGNHGERPLRVNTQDGSVSMPSRLCLYPFIELIYVPAI